MACSTTCSPTLVSLPNACAPLIRKNTARRIVAYKCNVEFTDITDSAEWATAFGAGDAVYSPEGVLTKGVPTKEYVQTNYNRQAVTNGAATVDFKSFDSKADLSDYDFWNKLQTEAAAWKIGYLTDEDWFYEMPSPTVETGTDAQESAPAATVSWMAKFQYNSITEIKPIAIPGLSAIIDAL